MTLVNLKDSANAHGKDGTTDYVSLATADEYDAGCIPIDKIYQDHSKWHFISIDII